MFGIDLLYGKARPISDTRVRGLKGPFQQWNSLFSIGSHWTQSSTHCLDQLRFFFFLQDPDEYWNGLPHLNEKQKRLLLAAEAKALGWGGVSRVAQAAGVSRGTIHKAFGEIESPPLVSERIRKPGGGRKGIQVYHPDLLKELESLVDPVTRGDPMSPLRWTCKSTRQLSGELMRQGYRVSHMTVAELLHRLDYSLQANAKTLEGGHHADRNDQFNYINTKVKQFLQRGQPVISVDTKKKELVGNFKNGGREWGRKEEPEEVEVHDFATPESPKVIPYGIYDIGKNMGWVNVGCDHDTASFAVASIRRW